MDDLLEKIYSGLLGKAIGVRLGAPIEPYQWDYERIKESFGDIRGYVKNSERFAADDDTNGPVFFIRAMVDEENLDITTEKVARAWMNYTRDGQGMFWWGGEGVSTEHTAYSNLKKGVSPDRSGKSIQNTVSLSEQVGGQIFIDSWGLIHPGDMEKAMDAAETAAAVSHDGEALVGARFIGGLIACAFVEKDIEVLVSKVLTKLPSSSLYRQAMEDMRRFHREHPQDFRAAYDYAQNRYSYAHFAGMCPVIPNACLVLIGLLYGDNDFARSIEITCMCGWDTDSNAGVVGTIMGVLKGIDGIPEHYRSPVNDLIIGSSMSPTLNVINLPVFAKFLAGMAEGQTNEAHELSLDFSLKGSTSGLRIRNDFRLLRDQRSRRSKGSYDILVDNLVKGDEAALYYQTFYQTKDFGDNRYDPVFAPLAYPGQKLTVELESEISFLDDLWIAPYVRYANGDETTDEFRPLTDRTLEKVEYTLPEHGGRLIREVGIKVRTDSAPVDGNGLLGRIRIRTFSLTGTASYSLNQFSFEEGFLRNVAPFSNHRITTELFQSQIRFEAKEEQGISLTGHYFAKDVELCFRLEQCKGGSILVPFRAKGLENYYFVRIEENALSIEQRLHGSYRVLRKSKTSVNFHESMHLHLIVKGDQVIFLLNDGAAVLTCEGIENAYGHFGLGGENASFQISSLQVTAET
ncbi:ADP-ribosylglycohydrolase family protein [Proteiniclasticum sp. SCR006]|uniref:ADP-ribosylglycohydrolase family protein n=1 Tax=Proteiniclasticum aestuarii TaxID=2817862 RepID=A0A939HCL8_9CLOT|nr:ADP-ribosylglycohydrolase family protein [Proteiniclasticum aestuarii]MBO1265115.1 ADP-ribosylglycohydrolase family protein [Proteiniclasticum aestuarii]